VLDPVPGEDNPPPVYPGIARRRGWEGRVLLRVSVSADGRATSVEVARSSGRGVLDRAAAEAVTAWTFTPASRNGTPIAGATQVSIRFQLDG
jgi:protein TonB